MEYRLGTQLVLQGAFFLGALAVVAWTPSSATALPAPEELVPNTVARIADAASRDDETISRAELHHGVVLAAAGEGLRRAPRPGEEGREPLERAALNGMIEAVWLRGQAAEMDIVVTRGQIRRLLAEIKRENFPTAAEFHAFMKQARMTRRDVYERVELQILSARIGERVLSGAKGEAEEEEAFTEFLDEFNARWRARTVCAPELATRYCSNGPASGS
jgi:hypothetical protein